MIPSIRIENTVELINITPVNPLISQCEIKVCYVGDEPNRNRSIITKDVAKVMANSLPGSPIVGYYNEELEDFEEHNKMLEIKDGKLSFKDNTRPYGFVDLHARVWFEKFLEDGVEREYLMTTGYLWTGQYPEAQRIIDKGNNQSMELDDKIINAYWTKDDKGKPQFFIINEAIISKLCILGEDIEPCFEGAQITKLEFSLGDSFKEQLFSLMNEMKKILNEGGASTVNTYAVEIGGALWDSLWNYIVENYPEEDCDCCSQYRLEGVYEEDGQKFAILQHRDSQKYYRLDFTLSEEEGFAAAGELAEVTQTFVPAEEPQFDPVAVEEYALQYRAAHEVSTEEPEEIAPEAEEVEEPVEEPETEPVQEPEVEEDEPVQYNLEEITEYTELRTAYADLEARYAELETQLANAQAVNAELTTFKANIVKKEKQAMINSFYMLSDEDKADVIANIDNYSLDDIEAKLSIICVRNKVNFSLDDEDNQSTPGAAPMTYNLQTVDLDDSVPAWIKAIQNTAKNMN